MNKHSEWLRGIAGWINEGSAGSVREPEPRGLIEAADHIDRLETALDELQKKESEYRFQHDTLSDGHLDTGRAWDRMRKAGNKAREALKT